MFDSLVESGSHKDDVARKGSFFLGTLVVYGVLLTAAAVASIYFYDARLANQNLELVTLVAPVPMAPEPPKAEEPKNEPKPEASSERQVTTRTEISVVAPVVASKEVAKETTREVARNVPVVVSNRDFDPVGGGQPVAIGTGVGVPGGTGTQPAVRVEEDEPPPPPKPTPTPAPKRTAPVSGGVLNGKAISKPQPPYPAIAKAARASGTVTVQILVDESGRVVSASAVGGHPLLQQAAVSAARQARFSPTLLSGQPVKVSGVITYNFVLN